jgi:hypothetical protein
MWFYRWFLRTSIVFVARLFSPSFSFSQTRRIEKELTSRRVVTAG